MNKPQQSAPNPIKPGLFETSTLAGVVSLFGRTDDGAAAFEFNVSAAGYRPWMNGVLRGILSNLNDEAARVAALHEQSLALGTEQIRQMRNSRVSKARKAARPKARSRKR
jgi:hypothetical protein